MAVVKKRMLIDTSKCTACRACQVVCKQWHSLPAEDTTFKGTYTNPPDKSGANLTVVKFTETEIAGKLRFLFFNDRCRHCDVPACKGACLWGAVKRKPNGIVYIDHTICNPNVCTSNLNLDRPCMSACPYHVPKWKYIMGGVTQGLKPRKCDFCYNRFTDIRLKTVPFISKTEKMYDTYIPPDPTKSGDNDGICETGEACSTVTSAVPACQLTCPPGAIKSGKYAAMLNQARNKVTYLRNNGHSCANVYPPQTLTDVINCGLGSTLSRQRLTHVIWVLLEHPSVYGL